MKMWLVLKIVLYIIIYHQQVFSGVFRLNILLNANLVENDSKKISYRMQTVRFCNILASEILALSSAEMSPKQKIPIIKLKY